MKKGFSFVIVIVLVLLIGALGFFSYKLIFNEKKILVPDFSQSSVEDVLTWCKSQETNPCSFEYDYSETVAENGIIYQSISADEELGESQISFTISLGKKYEINVPIVDKDTNRSTIEDWATKNGVTNTIEYVEEYSDTVEQRMVIKIEPSVILSKEETIKVYISKGVDPTKEKQDDKKDTNEIEVEFGDFINITEEEFITKTKALGLKPNHKESKDSYSTSIDKDLIVWHGSGYYVDGETINYGLSLGKDGEGIEIEKDAYVGKTEDEFKKIAEDLGLVPVHEPEWDATSSTVEKGNIVRHGYTDYVKGENIRYGLSLGDSEEESEDEYFAIKAGEYKGKTLDEFTKLMKEKGLSVAHSTVYEDEYSDTVAKGSILWHGSATDFKKGETIHYTLSLGKESGEDSGTIYIEQNAYVGKTEDEFKKIANDLGLVPVHNSDWDNYSDTLEKGKIIRHGYTEYEKGENFRYGLSLGKKEEGGGDEPEVKTVSISSNQYVGKSESNFKSTIEGLGLKASHDSSKDEYSSESAGTIVWHNSGTFKEGDTVAYGLSKGSKTVSVLGFEAMSNYEGSTYDETETNLRNYYVNTCGFSSSNVHITGQKASHSAGIIESISINGSALSNSGGSYAVSSTVDIVISTGFDS